MRNEIKSLTGLRGVAALYVALYHLFGKIQVQINPNSIFQEKHMSAFMLHGYLSVDIFFILSAYVITLSSIKLFSNDFKFSNYLLFMKKRWARIYPIYFVVVIVAYFLLYRFEFHKIIFTTLTLTCAIIGRGDILGSLWSLSTEWFAYLLYPLLLQTLRLNKKPILFFIAIIGLLFLLFYISKPNNFSLDLSKGVRAFIRCFAEYIIGMYIYCIVKDKKADILNNKYVSAFIPIPIIILLFFKKIDIVIVALYIPLLISMANDKGIVARFFANKFFYFLGLVSFPLYLIHPIIVDNAWFRNKIDYIVLNYSVFYALLLYIMITITISYLVYKLIEMPLHKYFKKLLNC